MAATWTTPRTWIDGELVPSALMNEQVRDNVEWLKAVPKKSVQVYFAADFAIVNGWTVALFTSEDHDVGGFHDNAVNPDRLTIPEPGKYAFGVWWMFANSATGAAEVRVTLNEPLAAPGNPNTLVSINRARTIDNNFRQLIMGTRQLTTGDVLRAHAWQNTGSSSTWTGRTSGGERACGFWCHKISEP